jgi:uncharacterized membrane protein
MTSHTPAPGVAARDRGHYVFGLGVIALAGTALAIGDFTSGQPVPKAFPARAELAVAANVFMLLAGAAVLWPRIRVWGAGALGVYYTLVVVILMDGRSILRHRHELLAYTNTAEQVAIAAAAVILFAGVAPLDSRPARRLIRGGQAAFGIAAVAFGVAHFAFMNLTAPLVPAWLPPSQVFWGYATGVFHIAAGLAILTGVQARLAAILLTVMFAAFTPLVHLPLLLATPMNHGVWSENATNLVLIGCAWVVADSLARRGP